ncbi:MAG: histidinol dehydrogenase [Thermoplasmatota archaeon]
MAWPRDREILLSGRGTAPDLPFEAVLPLRDAVRHGGDQAVRDLALRFDGHAPDSLELPKEALLAAWEATPRPLQESLEASRDAIQAFHAAQRRPDMEWVSAAGARLGRRGVPVGRVGVYIPGGLASYPSTALMCVVPAKVAGVPEIIACTPPGPSGLPAAITLAALHLAGVDRVFRIGGAQAIFALAYGTQSVPAVHRIVGPGNAFVCAAKATVAGVCPIDAPAGPSEVLVVADGSCGPEAAAWDVLAQAEHDAKAWLAVASHDGAFLDEVEAHIRRRVAQEPRSGIIAGALSHALLVECPRDAFAEFIDAAAPEHLALQTSDARTLLGRVGNYGSAFLGPYSRVAFGDYASGTNHVLPTAGLARAWSGLSVDTFLRTPTHQEIPRETAHALAALAAPLADAEGLHAHAASMREAAA